MCFITNYRGKALKAKRDIWSYKCINHTGYGKHYDLYIDRRREKWTVGTHYTETNFPKQILKFRRIGANVFHSFKRKPKGCPFSRIIRTKIPKGSLYFENQMNYVSSDIIYAKDL